jgi:50S ribosome-binding GTPase/Type II intron maturase
MELRHHSEDMLRITRTVRRRPAGTSSCRLLRPFTTERKRDDEEYHIRRALRVMIDAKPEVTVVVEKVQLAGYNFLPRVAEEVIQSATIRIKCLTHADTVSDAALKQVIRIAQERDERQRNPNQRPAAIFALNLKQAKHLNPIRYAFFGASKLVKSNQILVCGVPNSGKSSLILPLTKARTMAVKKKQGYHLPKVSRKAGMTLGVKKHKLEAPNQNLITLLDTPGLRPLLQHSDPRTIALLLAANMTEPFTGYKKIASHDMILRILLQAVNRHADMSHEQPAYMEQLGLQRPTVDPSEFLAAYKASAGTAVADDLIRKFQNGEFGGLIFTPYRQLQNPDESELSINRTSSVLYMNDEAKLLVDFANGVVVDDFAPIARAAASRTINAQQQVHLKEINAAEPVKPGKPVVYPPYRFGLNCIACAGFIKRDDGGKKACGSRHTRVQSWSHMEILCYFSRMCEAFGGRWSGFTRYLFKDSLACTLAIKHKLRSRRAVYKKFKGLKEYPVPNDMRPKRYQIDQPIPWIHPCKRRMNSCRDFTKEMREKITRQMEKLNLTDHTFTLLRKRGQPVPIRKRSSSRKREKGSTMETKNESQRRRQGRI